MNAAARMVTGQRRSDHISETLRNLHWLRVPQRIIYKVGSIARRCLQGKGSDYLSDYLIPVSSNPGRSSLRSADRGDLSVPRARTIRAGGSSFRISGPTVWNSLSSIIRDNYLSDSMFASRLKTYLFRQSHR